MLEKEIEKALVRAVKRSGGMCVKLSCQGMDGMPDRLILMRDGRCAFAELKAPGKKPRPLQVKRMKDLTSLGFSCYVIDGKDQIQNTLDEIGGDAK